ncbi:MAG: hypothetical protein ABJF11_16505 [Reichenbachiella sp.]|uniref:hypothetical protein n=1 Tax=Reichenbachiella sp. TaxID=2184521 RepID=UPI003267725A
MIKITTLLTLALWLVSDGMANTSPDYTSDESREIVLKMINAHGGMDKWKKSKTFSFQNIMFSESLKNQPFWVSEVMVDQKDRRVYQDWLSHGASMSYDGKEAWSENWKIGNAPKFEALFFYYFLNLPWLTQDNNVTLGDAKRIKHEAFKQEIFVIDMGFSEKPAVGKTKDDTFKLYIDSESFLLVGYEYSIGYGYMLDLFGFPADKKLFGPMFRINDAFIEIDGLIYPSLMHTGNTEMTQIYGHHSIVNYALNKKFDNSRMKKTKTSILDNSSEKRK